ncbi:hypothetical protein [Streptococcus hyointestinalis]|uniref:hypothetical protein n=1 Tax=Streptococcus hyointestinalis TaxID=1337 RepID=UPI003F9E69D6
MRKTCFSTMLSVMVLKQNQIERGVIALDSRQKRLEKAKKKKAERREKVMYIVAILSLVIDILALIKSFF